VIAFGTVRQSEGGRISPSNSLGVVTAMQTVLEFMSLFKEVHHEPEPAQLGTSRTGG
jgi:hypothetical protein